MAKVAYQTKKGSRFEAELIRAQYGRSQIQIRPFEQLYRCWGDDCVNVVKFYIAQAPNLSVNTMMATIGWVKKIDGLPEQFECLECQDERAKAKGLIGAGTSEE